ncbi:MAG: nitroreductase family protein [Clostridiales Family XIII bacterium]|jgi:nitroreductase|nr:nitroreductase family protein [Clostridiales Family XIII bacterium]
MGVLEVIEARKSTRGFTAVPVPEDKLGAILKAGGEAPVGLGKYDAIHFTVIQNPGLIAAISDAATKGTEREGLDIYYGAGTVIVVSSAAQPAPGLEYSNAGAITQNFLLAATELGIDNVYIFGTVSGFANAPELLQKAGIPDGFKPVASVALGYAEDAAARVAKVPRSVAVNRVG